MAMFKTIHVFSGKIIGIEATQAIHHRFDRLVRISFYWHFIHVSHLMRIKIDLIINDKTSQKWSFAPI